MKMNVLAALCAGMLAFGAAQAQEPVNPQPAQPLTYVNPAYAKVTPEVGKKMMEDGRRITEHKDLKDTQKESAEKLAAFDKSYKRIINPHIYKVSLSARLRDLKTELIVQARTAGDEQI